jgi:hypothetical protein
MISNFFICHEKGMLLEIPMGGWGALAHFLSLNHFWKSGMLFDLLFLNLMLSNLNFSYMARADISNKRVIIS